MNKTAVVYDKWLSTLGGGEVVAGNFAKTLIEAGYQTTFACGQLVDPIVIKNKLNIDLSNAKFVEVWNDENKLKEITKDKDIFVNASYMDYMTGNAKKNYYYTSFPTDPSFGLKSTIITKLALPFLSKFYKPLEFITPPKMAWRQNKGLRYLLNPVTKLAFSFLQPNHLYNLNFSLFFEIFSKTELSSIDFSLKNASTKHQKVSVNHFQNLVNFDIEFAPTASTVYLNINNNSNSVSIVDPQVNHLGFSLAKLLNPIRGKIDSRLRAGFFGTVADRLKKYNVIFANSQFTQKWIKKYWHLNAQVLYPPVDLVKPNKSISKKNYICSVGRFFTLGHGKKQEVMIEAFKKLFNQGFKDWELHLAGGLGNEPTSLEFMKQLKASSKNYPIYFHINCSRKEIEELYLSSKIYWHAAGYGENQNKYPIKFEHFGIAPIEAMSAGCTPVLFNGGGLSEVVKLLNLEIKFHLFDTIDQLTTNTKEIIKQNIKLPTSSIKHLESLFGLKRFKKQFINTIQ